jgi:WD40 repeat protein
MTGDSHPSGLLLETIITVDQLMVDAMRKTQSAQSGNSGQAGGVVRGVCVDWNGGWKPAAAKKRGSYMVGERCMIVATGGDDSFSKLWNTFGGRQRKKLNGIDKKSGHKGPVMGIAATTNFEYLVTGSTDATAKVWEPRTGMLVHELKELEGGLGTAGKGLGGHTDAVTAVAISGDIVLTGSADGTARVWDIETGFCTQIMNHAEGAATTNVDGSPEMTPETLKMAALDLGGADSRSRTGKSKQTKSSGSMLTASRALRSKAGSLNAVAFSASAAWVVTGVDDGSARLWKVGPKVKDSTNIYRHTINKGDRYDAGVTTVATASWDKKGMLIATGSSCGNVKLWNAITGDCMYVGRC